MIGTLAGGWWPESDFGPKVQHAVAMRQHGSRIRIVSEEHWATSL